MKIFVRLPAIILPVGFFLLFVVGCYYAAFWFFNKTAEDQLKSASVRCPENSELCLSNNEIDNDIGDIDFSQQDAGVTSRALSLLALYFGAQYELVGYVDAQGDFYKVYVKENGTGKHHSFNMLLEKDLLMDGVLYTPLLGVKDLIPGHSVVAKSLASRNEKRRNALQNLKKDIHETLSNGTNIQNEINELVGTHLSTSAKIDSAHNNVIAATINQPNTMGVTQVPSVTKLETAPLPRNSNVLDVDDFYKDVSDSNWIEYGEGDKTLYVFFDLVCEGCREADKYLKDKISVGDLKVRYIPVSVKGELSLEKASLVLIPNGNAKRIRMMEEVYPYQNIPDSIKGVVPEEQLRRGRDRALANFKLLLRSKRPGTPMLVYMSKTGPIVATASSRDSIDKLISQIVPVEKTIAQNKAQ